MALPRDPSSPPPPSPAPAVRTTAPKAPAPVSGGAFIDGVLKGLNVPVTAGNIAFLNAWMNREGGGGANNPLNTTQRMPGSTTLTGNSAGVQNYRDLPTGVEATIATLRNGRYGDVLGALASGKPNLNGSYAGLGTWSGGGYSSLQGVSTAPATTSTGNINASDADITSKVEATYGYPASYLKNPEIGPILLNAARNGWDPDRLRGALYATKWWKTHSDTARTFDAAGTLDPASQQQQIRQQVDNINAEAKQLGLIVDPGHLAQMAVDSLRFGWDDHQLRAAMVSEGKFDFSGKQGSAALTMRDNLQAMADQQLVPIDTKTLNQWVSNITKGNVKDTDFEGYVKAQAKSLFPSLGAALDSGVTVKQYVNPYASLAVNNGVASSADAINWMDPKYQQAINQVDPKTGQRTAMSLSDWQTKLRTDPSFGYDKTAQAKQTSADLGQQLSQLAGAG